MEMTRKKLLVEIDADKKTLLHRVANSRGTSVAFIIRGIIDAWAEEYNCDATQEIIKRGFEASHIGDQSCRGATDRPGFNCAPTLPWLDSKSGC